MKHRLTNSISNGRKSLIVSLVVLASSGLSACGSDEQAVVSNTGTVKFDEFCTMPGLSPALRQTLLVIDQSAVKPSKPETFRSENATLLALATGLGDAQRATSSGAMAPRERLTIAVADPGTGGFRQIFTGCLPGVSDQELRGRLAAGEDGFSASYFGSDLQSKISDGSEAFLKQVLMALVQVHPTAPVSGSESIQTTGLARVAKAIGPGAPGIVRRIFIYSDPTRSLSTIGGDYALARTSAFAAAQQLQGNLGQAELYIVPAGRAQSDLQKAFLDAFFLGLQADVRFVGPFSADNLARPPVKLLKYAGELPLAPGVRTPMDMRLAVTADGTLANSWISYTGSQGVRATPISGQFACAAADSCELRGDPNLGLGQRWRTQAGVAPQPMPGGPFGGMRMITGRDDGQAISGRIFDPIILVGTRGDIPFTAKRLD